MDLDKLLDERTNRAEATLAAAVRLDLHCFLGAQVEGRMRARPHFLRKTPRDLLIEIRKALERHVDTAAEDLMKAAWDLRVFLGATTRTAAEEQQALADAVGARALKIARSILVTSFFPGDGVPDGPASDVVDASPKYALPYAPTPALAWAWATVRELDRVRFALAAAKGGPVADSYELRRHLPEALPAQTW